MSENEFECRVRAALQRTPAIDVRAKARIMDGVRAAASESPRSRDYPFRRGARHSLVGLVLAAGVGSITTVSVLLPPAGGGVRDGTGVAIGDTLISSLRDTLRLVRLIFDDSSARHVAVVGDFNGWRSGATPLERHGATRRWTATLALRGGTHRYAFVVDGTRWTPDPSAERVRADDGRVYSLLHVARTAN